MTDACHALQTSERLCFAAIISFQRKSPKPSMEYGSGRLKQDFKEVSRKYNRASVVNRMMYSQISTGSCTRSGLLRRIRPNLGCYLRVNG
jgi:hypothetical protein